jgi:trimeric autotransporter adhesin
MPVVVSKYLKSRFSVHFFILFAISEVLNIQASTLKAVDLRAFPNSIVFSAVQGHSYSATRSIFIFSSDQTVINWSLTKDVSWLTTDLQATVTDTVVKAGVNTTGLSAGIYYGNIILTSPESTAGPVIIAVTLVVNPDVPVIITPWKGGHSGAFSVSVDDSKGSGFDQLQAIGAKGTYVLESVTVPSFYATYYNAGMELGSHSIHHICSEVSDDVLRTEEIEPSIDILCTETPQPCQDLITFVWPCGYTNYHEQAVISDYFLSARGYNINQLEDQNPDNFMNLKSYNSHEHKPYPPADLKTVVDDAVAQKKWFNMVLHDYTNDDGAIAYSASKDIWVAPIGTVVKYIFQRERFVLSNFVPYYDKITFDVSRLPIPSSPLKNFEAAIESTDVITMQVDVDDSKTVEDVLVNGTSNPFQIKSVNGNSVLLTDVKLESGIKSIIVKYHITTIGLTVTGLTANSKIYDRTTAATINTGSLALVGVLPGDVVTLLSTGATGAFVNKNAGTGKTVTTTGFTLGGADAIKYFINQPSTTANITQVNLTITGVTANNKVYNGSVAAVLNTTGAALSGILAGDDVTLNPAGATGAFANKNVSTGKTVTTSGFTLGGTDAGNYNLIQPILAANITAAGLTVTGITANNKVYDGTVSAVINSGSAALAGVIGTDVVTLIKTNPAGTFADKNAGTAKVVTASGFSIGGTDSGNYTLTQPATTANITRSVLTISGVTVNNKVYNATTGATLNTGSATLAGIFGGDAVSLVSGGATGVFPNRNIGTGKPVTISGFTLGGNDAANYTLTQPSGTADITPAVLLITGVTANNKVYDGTTAATLNTGSAVLSGVFGGDIVTLNKAGAIGTFQDNKIGFAKLVTITGFTISGTDSGNYSLTQPTATADITGILLTISGVTAANKAYDGSVTATLNTAGATISGVIPGNDVTLVTTGAAGTFADKNAGAGKTVITSGFTLSGTDADKYTPIQPSTTATISKANLTVSGVTGVSRAYNRTTIAALITSGASLSGVFGADAVILISTGATGTFADWNVGTGIQITTSGFTLGGTDAVNYSLAQPVTSANITGAVLTITGVTANNKVYDGTTVATLNTGSAALTGIFGGDIVSLNSGGAVGTFANPYVGTGKIVTISGFTMGGTDSGNYSLTQPSATADISGVVLNVTGVTANNKVYDGTTTAVLNTGSAVINGVLGSDIVNLVSTGAAGTFSGKNAGNNKAVSTSGFTITGPDAGKYSITQPATVADILKAGITVSGVTANNKVYNGTTAATLNFGTAVLTGVFGSDAVNLVTTAATANFSDKNTGIAKIVSISGLTLTGADAGNYNLTQPSATANITGAGLTISGVSANNKTYDGLTVAAINTGGAVLTGIIGTDLVTLNKAGASGTFANKNAGTGKSVITSGFTIGGADASNYALAQPTVTADITKAVLSLSGVTAYDKVYNGTTAATLNTGAASLSGILGSDNVTLVSGGATGTFVNKNTGSGKQVTTSGFTVGGTDGANYTITQPSTFASITTAVLTVSGVTGNKVYDGTVVAPLNAGSAVLSGLFGSDIVNVVSTGATGTFVNKNAGTGKSVTTTGFTLSGTDAGNYTLTQPVITANITTAGLTVTGLTASNKVYNGTATATLNTGSVTLVGVLTGDNVNLSSTGVTGTFINKNAGTAKTVNSAGFTLSGTDAANYSLTQPSTTANITAANLSISGVTANNKVYNGNATATLSSGSALLTGVFGSDVVSLNSAGATGTFVNKNVGTGKSVSTSGFALGGTDSGNYNLTQPITTADITAANLTVSGISANNKTYDGTNTATLNTGSATLTGVFGTDQVTLSSSGASGTFANETVGAAKAVSTTGFLLGGNDSGNYTLTQPVIYASINGISLTVIGVTADNKVYDGTTDAILHAGNASLVGVNGSDAVTLVANGVTGSFINKNSGTAKNVLISGFTLGGADAVNYSLTQPVVSADITNANLSLSGVIGINKVYNGTTSADLNTGNATLSGVIGPDIVTLVSSGATGIFTDKNTGIGKSVSTSGFTLDGNDAANYNLIQPVTNANITPANLSVSGVTANNKIYDASSSVTINTGGATLTGVFGTDVVSVVKTGARGSFVNKNAGTGKLVTITGFTLTGSDVSNYVLAQPTTTADITRSSIELSGVQAENKVYDGTTTATLNSVNATLTGIVPGDNIILVTDGVTGNFVNKNSGSGKSVVTSGFILGGTDADNYNVSQPLLTADITKASLTVAGVTAENKVYDGTRNAVLNTGNKTMNGVFGNDAVMLVMAGATGTFSDKNAGSGKIVTVSGFTVTGTDAVNYNLIQPSLSADISPKPLTITGNNLIKHYNTTLTFSGTEFTVEGLVSGDSPPAVTITSLGAPASAEVGKYPISIDGSGDNNYNITYVSGILTVGKSLLIATAENKTKIYGSENPQLSISYTGFYKNENASSLDDPPVAMTTAITGSNAGSYPITVTGGSDKNYDLVLVNGTLDILKAPLTITTEDKTRLYGEENPEFTIVYSGFVAGDDQRVLDAIPVAGTEADINSDAGNYDINISAVTAANYTVTTEKGTLQIMKADQVISFDDMPAGLRMTQEYPLKARASSGLEVSFELSNTDIASLNGNILTIKKDGDLTITAMQGGDRNWNPAPDAAQAITALPTFDAISSLFTPNNDGMNDYWYIPDIINYGKIQVNVYNRFGQTVYESDSYKNDWDGTWNGSPLPSASYYYIIKSSKKGLIKGVVNIVR